MTIEAKEETAAAPIAKPEGAAEILINERAKRETKTPKAPAVASEKTEAQRITSLMLTEKLLEIEKEMPEITKTGHNENQNYDFVEQQTIMNTVRPLLQKYGVLVIPRVVDHSVSNKQGWNIKANAVTETGVKVVVKMVFQFINVHGDDDTLDIPWTAEGDDWGDKGTNKATTIAQKNMYIRLFNIADTDPDAETPAGGSVATPTKSITPQKQTMIYTMLEALGVTVEAYEVGLKKSVEKLTNEEADQAIAAMQAAIMRKRVSETAVA